MNKTYLREKQKTGGGLAVAILKGTGVALICAAAVVTIFCIVALRFDDPGKTAPIFGVAAMLITAFCGGFASAKAHGGRGVLCGAVFGVLFALILAVAAIVAGASLKTAAFLILSPAAVLISALGGVAGAAERKPKKKKRKKY